MVGFIGTQKLLSSQAGGAFATTFDVITLKDGTILNAYKQSAFGDLLFYTLKGPKAEAKEIGSFAGNGLFGSTNLQMKEETVFPLDHGGFGLVVNKPTADSADAQRVLYQQFNADGSLRGGQVDLVSGRLDDVKAFSLSNGGFVLGYSQLPEGSFIEERVIEFYNARGRLVEETTIADGVRFSSSGQAEAATLANGNLAMTWRLDDGSVQVQVFRPDGTRVGRETPGNISGFDAEITALPGRGFVVVTRDEANSAFVVQAFNNDGSRDGRSFSTTQLSGDLGRGGDHEVGVTEDGLLLITWEGQGVGFGNGDVFMKLVTLDGAEVLGPTILNENRNDSQADPAITTLNDGRLFVGFLDRDFVPFGYQDSIQGRYIESPDTLWTGTDGNNRKTGTGGEDVLLGLGGNDVLNGGGKGDYLRGGAGDDTLAGGGGSDQLLGDGGSDELVGGPGNDTLSGGAGADLLSGGPGNDLAEGGDGNDTLRGSKGNDTLDGGAGADNIRGDAGNDSLLGGDGNDTLNASAGDDRMNGGEGKDRVNGDGGNDFIEGGAGKDTLKGGTGNDILRGGDDADKVYGDAGDDTIFSDGGNDKEFGGAGDDTFFDSDGNDRMEGGPGADTFRFQDTVFGKDVITDFEFRKDVLDMGTLARALELSGGGDITVRELAGGVRFAVDKDNWVLVKDAELSDFGRNDFIIEDPFG